VTETKDMNRFAWLCASLTALALLPPTSEAVAQDYPTRPVRVIATSSAGGTSDIFMRALADELHKSLGQPFIVENRPGGAFNIGARACAEAPPDGYTLCIIPGEPLVFNQRVLRFEPWCAHPNMAADQGFRRGWRQRN
jgi:tripartite-type tricarboxylate transporter receptor subunit TctC